MEFYEILFNIIGFACLGIVVSMQMAHANQWICDNTGYTYTIPYPLRCNKCLTFWSCLAYNLITVNLINAILIAAIAAILSIIIYNRL